MTVAHLPSGITRSGGHYGGVLRLNHAYPAKSASSCERYTPDTCPDVPVASQED